jgi:hypothetical protein
MLLDRFHNLQCVTNNKKKPSIHVEEGTISERELVKELRIPVPVLDQEDVFCSDKRFWI